MLCPLGEPASGITMRGLPLHAHIFMLGALIRNCSCYARCSCYTICDFPVYRTWVRIWVHAVIDVVANSWQSLLLTYWGRFTPSDTSAHLIICGRARTICTWKIPSSQECMNLTDFTARNDLLVFSVLSIVYKNKVFACFQNGCMCFTSGVYREAKKCMD